MWPLERGPLVHCSRCRRVGSSGRVYAVETTPQIHLSSPSERSSKCPHCFRQRRRSVPPQQSVDAVLILKTYHEIAQPVRLLKHLRQSMRSGARLGIIDRNGTGDHGLDRDTVVSEARRAGFELEAYDFVKPDGMDYFFGFQANG